MQHLQLSFLLAVKGHKFGRSLITTVGFPNTLSATATILYVQLLCGLQTFLPSIFLRLPVSDFVVGSDYVILCCLFLQFSLNVRTISIHCFTVFLYYFFMTHTYLIFHILSFYKYEILLKYSIYIDSDLFFLPLHSPHFTSTTCKCPHHRDVPLCLFILMGTCGHADMQTPQYWVLRKQFFAFINSTY